MFDFSNRFINFAIFTAIKGLAKQSRVLSILYNPRDFNSTVWHPVNVASVLPIGRPKRDKWHLTKTLGSLGFYISWFQFDPWLRLAVAWIVEEKGVFLMLWKKYSLLQWQLHFHINLGHVKMFIKLIIFIKFINFVLISSRKTKFSMASCELYFFKILFVDKFSNTVVWRVLGPPWRVLGPPF